MKKNSDSFYNDEEYKKLLGNDDIRTPLKKKRIPIWARVLITVLAVITVSSAALGGYVIGSMYKKPNVKHGDEQSVGSSESGSENKPEPSSGKSGSSRKDDFYTFLVVGKDSGGLNTDVIMVVSFDVANKKISVMQIPRDTYVNVDDKDYKINAMLSKYYQKARRAGESGDLYVAGIKGLSGVISSNMNIKLDYYILVNLEGFRNIIDILGGVYINVPRDMYYEDPDQDLYINLKQGWQTLNGKQSEQFVRFRKGYATGDIGRVDAQKLFLSALFNSAKKNITLDKIPSIVNEAVNNITTDLSVSDIIYFAKKMLDTDISGLGFITLPGEGAYAYGDHGTSYYVMHKNSAYRLIKDNFFVFKRELEESEFDSGKAFTCNANGYINGAYTREYDPEETEFSNAKNIYE